MSRTRVPYSATVQRLALIVSLVAAVLGVRADLYAADCNDNGTEDAADIANAVSADCNNNGLPDECEGIPVELGLGSEVFPAPSSPRFIKSGDFNGDALADVVVVNSTFQGSKIVVLLGNGRRRFAPLAEYSLPQAYGIAIGDLDGDGLADVVSANADTLHVLHGREDGTLDTPVVYNESPTTRIVEIVDVNGDDAPDVLAADRLNMSVRLNNGDGTLGEPSPVETPPNPQGFAAADFNGDGHVDLATGNRVSNTFNIFLGAGDGTFSPPTSYPIGNGLVNRIAAADIDLDGFPDLIAAANQRIAVVRNNGDGTFGATESYSSPTPRSLSVADFNRDGAKDLVFLIAPNNVALRVNDGAGRFGFAEIPSGVAAVPLDLAVADYDGDGGMDVAVVAQNPNSLQFIWNGADNALSAVQVQFPAEGCNSGCRPHSGIIADLTGDGFPEAIGTSTHVGTISILMNDGKGQMTSQTSHSFGNEHPQSTDAGDFDKDGDIDLVTCDNHSHDIWVHLNNGDATFAPPRLFPTGPGPLNVKVADFDQDGNLDAATADQGGRTVSVLFGIGDGNFGPALPLLVRNAPKSVTPFDAENDGDLDIAVANGSAFVSLLRNRGDGTFDESEEFVTIDTPNDIASGDFDGDGFLDLVTADTVRSSATVLLNLGDGTFGGPVSFLNGASAPYSVLALDFDLDGRVDIVTGNQSSANVTILRGRGDATFEDARVFPAGEGLRFVLSGDFDQDGDPDLMTTDRQGNSLTLLYNGASEAEPTLPFLEEICTPADFHTLSAAASDSSSKQRFLKYTLHVGSDPTQLPDVAYQDTNLYPLHEEFLRSEFPDQFPALSPKLYDDLVGVRASRQYFVGAISRLATDTAPVYGFSVFAKFNDPLERLSADEVKAIYDKLRESFHVEPLAYFPNSRAAVEVAREWVEPGFPIQFETASGVPTTYEPYTLATGIGRVRILSTEEFEAANSNGEFSFQDILVLPQAPRDIEGVVSGVVTAEPQGELSHVAVRTNRRGTPNAFVSEALELLTPFAGRLVRLEVACSGLVISEATPEEAQEFWERRRPTLSAKPSVDPDFTGFPDLTEIAALDTADEGFPSEARVGGKATAMARLQTVLDGDLIEYGEVGFAIPVHYYLEFMRSNQIPSAIDSQRLVTYEQYVNELANDPMFLTDPRFRFAALETLRLHIEGPSQISNLLVAQLTARIVEVFGSSFLRVRFRSSSNVEDALEFNGAGLYDSTSVCAADDLDSDTAGPSRCQQFKSNERGVARGLRKVWASLWNFRAYEERAFYGIPNDRVAMAVFVSRAFPDERANGVAFTGNPTNARDRRYVVTVQLGEESVVTPEPGVLPEKDVLEVENGKVERIIRAVPSSLLPRDNYVLSDDELNELGALMWRIDQGFPLDTAGYDRSEVLLDMEIKIEQSGDLAVKQVRPFLLTNAAPPSPTFQLLVRPGTSSCGMFTQGRGVLTEYELKSTIRLNSGSYSLPTDVETFAGDLIEEILIGPDRRPATPINSGLFSMQKIDAGGREFIYRFGYTQDFELPGGERFELILSELDFVAGECTEQGETRVLDADALTDSLFLQGSLLVGESLRGITYSACGHETLPLWKIEAELADGTQIVLKERFRPELFRDFGPASLTYAAVDFSGLRRTERDYFNLVYSSARHNEYTVYMTVFDTPVTLDGLSATVRAIELRAPVPREGLGATAFYLDNQLSVIAEREVVSYTKERLEAEQLPIYRRGDVNGDGLALSDAVLILGHLFSATGVPPSCEKSADVDDSGVLDVRDPLWILLYLFAGGGAPPEPFLACGGDPTPDGLKCASSPVCE